MLNRETAIAELLRVPVPDEGGALDALGAPDRPQSYREARLEIGDAVTIIGRALPFSDLADPVASDYGFETAWLDTDPEIAADLAEARASGTLTGDPEEAWGNAAIPGFGIGRPVTAPQIDLAARQLPLATAAQADGAEQIFEIDPETLVVASSAEVPLVIAYGTPGAVMDRSRTRFAIGLLARGFTVWAVGCEQGEGDRCQSDSDCKGGGRLDLQPRDADLHEREHVGTDRCDGTRWSTGRCRDRCDRRAARCDDRCDDRRAVARTNYFSERAQRNPTWENRWLAS